MFPSPPSFKPQEFNYFEYKRNQIRVLRGTGACREMKQTLLPPYWPRLTRARAAGSEDVASWAAGAWELNVGGGLGEQGDGRAGGGCQRRVCASQQLLRPEGRVTRALFSLPTRLSLYSCSQTVRSVMMVLITEAKRSCVWWAGGRAHPPRPESSFLPLLGLAVCHLFSQSPLLLACGFLFSI